MQQYYVATYPTALRSNNENTNLIVRVSQYLLLILCQNTIIFVSLKHQNYVLISIDEKVAVHPRCWVLFRKRPSRLLLRLVGTLLVTSTKKCSILRQPTSKVSRAFFNKAGRLLKEQFQRFENEWTVCVAEKLGTDLF